MIYCLKSSTYASAKAGKYNFYYGFEITDPVTQDWCFVVRKSDKEIFRVTNEVLLNYCSEPTPLGMLVAGLALYFANK